MGASCSEWQFCNEVAGACFKFRRYLEGWDPRPIAVAAAFDAGESTWTRPSPTRSFSPSNLGAYTFLVAGVSGTTGVALVEVYLLP